MISSKAFQMNEFYKSKPIATSCEFELKKFNNKNLIKYLDIFLTKKKKKKKTWKIF